jgi:predicted O-methyltransferase YrrM
MTEPEALVEVEGRKWLRRAAAAVPFDRAIVEVGVFQGSSLLELARGSAEGLGARVYGIDPWAMEGSYPGRPHMLSRYGPKNQRIAAAALKREGLQAELIRDFGGEVARGWDGPPVGLLFIDAIHRQKEVTEDFLAWKPRLAPGAVVAFDDYCERFSGVIRAVDKLFGKDRVHLAGSRLAWVIV